MLFRILGSLEAVDGGHEISLGGGRQRAVLGLLLLDRNRAVAADRLIDELWGERPPRTAANLVQVYVSRLRKALGKERLVTSGPGYVLRVAEGELDLDRFERLAEEGMRELDRDEPERASQLLREALGLWRGPALADVVFEGSAHSEIARLEELRLAVLENRIEADLGRGRHALLVGELETLVGEHPFRERLRGQLMVALYRSDRQAEALEVYRDTRRTFVDELGLEPGPTLQDLERAILAQDPALAAPAVPAEAGSRWALPVPPTALVGREREVEEIVSLVRAGARLVTLTGTGGTGKTRLALEAAAALAGDFRDGASWVPLDTVRDPGHVVAAISEVVGATEPLEHYFAARQALLLLDNFEHVLQSATVVSSLLATSPELVVVATSREPLHLAAEHEYPVFPLDAKAASSLFLDRARAVRPDFAGDDLVPDICFRLDNLPLAIELAAARIRILSPQLLLNQLQRHVELLTDGPRDAPERHRSLHATLDWSYALLSDTEGAVFARLSVFVGRFTIDAAEAVCGDGGVFAVLTSLVEKNLVRRTEDLAGEPRFSLLETIREYAAERLAELGDTEPARRAHAEWYAALAAGLHEDTVTFESTSLERIYTSHAAERGDLHAALRWFSEAGDTDALMGLCACRALWLPGLVTEGRRMLASLLEQPRSGPSPARVRALTTAAYFAIFQHDAAPALRFAEEAATLARGTGEDGSRLAALLTLQAAAAELDDRRRSYAAAREGEQLSRELRQWSFFGAFISNRANLDATEGRYESAKRGFTEALAVILEHGASSAMRAIVTVNLALIAVEQGRLAEAADRVTGGLGLLEPEIPFYDSIRSDGLNCIAAIAIASADPRTAARLSAAAQTWREHEGVPLGEWEQRVHDRTSEAVRAALPADELMSAWDEGARMGLREAVADALRWTEKQEVTAAGTPSEAGGPA